jgi:rSAM/selenodomain-associated transferase 2
MSLTFSIIIPVLHEAAIIRRTVERIRALDGGEAVEIIVVDGDPAGGTLQSISDTSVRKILSGPGRGRQLNRGASIALGEILIFLHADTLLPKDALCSIKDLLLDTVLAGGAFELRIESARPIFRLIERVSSCRSRLTRIPYGDQAIFLRRSCFQSLSGFRDLPIMEEVDLMRRLRLAGNRIVILPDRVLTSARRWEKEGVFYTTFRNWILVTLFLLGVDAGRLARWYLPHGNPDDPVV